MKTAPWAHQPDFLKLQRDWNSKLSREGLPEEPDTEFRVKQRYWRDPGKATYYADAQAFYYAKRWRDLRDKTIWRLHADGETVRAIEDFLAGLGYKNCSRNTVHNTILRIVKDFKAWRLSELRKEETLPTTEAG